jgi:hypothetical protein
MFFNKKKTPAQQANEELSKTLPSQHGSLFAPSLNPRPSRLGLNPPATTMPFTMETSPITGYPLPEGTPDIKTDSSALAPAWFETVPTEESWESSLPQPQEEGIPAFEAGGFSWDENPTELNNPSPEPLGLEVSMPWTAEPSYSSLESVSNADDFNFELPTEMGSHDPFFSGLSETPAFTSPTVSLQPTKPEENTSSTVEEVPHFLDTVHTQYYPADSLSGQSALSSQEQPITTSEPQKSTWSEGISEFDSAAHYLFPETADINTTAQSWYEQSELTLSNDSTPGAIYWPDEVLSQEALDLGTSFQNEEQGFKELTDESPNFAIDQISTLPETDFPIQPLFQPQINLSPVLSPEEPSDSNLLAAEMPDTASTWPSATSWEQLTSAAITEDTELQSATWLFPTAPEAEPALSPNIYDLENSSLTPEPVWPGTASWKNDPTEPSLTPLADAASSWYDELDNNMPTNPQDPFTKPLTEAGDSNWKNPKSAFNESNPWDSSVMAPDFNFNLNPMENSLAPNRVAPYNDFGVDTSRQIPTLIERVPHTEVEEAKTNRLDILGLCSLPGQKRLLLVNNDDVYALMGQEGLEDDAQVSVLQIFDRNPLAYQTTFTAVPDTRPNREGSMIVQIGSFRGQVSVIQGKIVWQGEAG